MTTMSTLTTSSTLLSRRDLRFLLEEWLDLDSFARRVPLLADLLASLRA